MIKKLFLPALVTVMITACSSIHEFPDDNGVNPYLAEIFLSIDIDMAMDNDSIFQTYANTLDDYYIRYIVDIYENNPENKTRAVADVADRVQRIVKTEKNVINKGIYNIRENLKLPQKDYRVIVWIDFVDKETTDDKYYNTGDLQQVSVKYDSERRYRGYHESKDVFVGNADMDLTVYKNQRFVNHNITVNVKRPFAAYQIIAVDVDKYLEWANSQIGDLALMMPAGSVTAYNFFLPTGYNAFIYAPDNFLAGVNYRYGVTEIVPQKEALVAMDFVFVEDDTFYSLDFEILNGYAEHINTVRGLRVNLKRNKMTVIKGAFLTENLNAGSVGVGGDNSVGIDDNFYDEIFVEL